MNKPDKNTINTMKLLISSRLISNADLPVWIKAIILETPDTAGQLTLSEGVTVDMSGNMMILVVDLHDDPYPIYYPSDMEGLFPGLNRACLTQDGSNHAIIYNSLNDWVGPLMIFYINEDTGISEGIRSTFKFMLIGVMCAVSLQGTNGGALSTLNTTSKNVVGAINELSALTPIWQDTLARYKQDTYFV